MRRFELRAVLSAILLFISFASALGQSAPKKLDLLDVFNLQLALDPQVSPDGKHIVYVRQWSDVMSDRRCSNLWIVDADGTNNRALTEGNVLDSSPRWSP